MQKIAIVGGHRRTKLLAPFEESDWDIWSLSPSNERELLRHDAWFELHSRAALQPQDIYLEWLKMLPLVYMQTADPEFPGSVAYPKDEMVARFGSQFFTNSIAWMLALAITRSPPAIGVWGVEGSTHDEYHQERPGTLHFIELARALGIDLVREIALLLDSAEKRGREEGRREEAERIVRWLRAAVEEGNVAVCMAETRAEYERAVGFAAGFQIAADAIEAGKHHEPAVPEGDSDE